MESEAWKVPPSLRRSSCPPECPVRPLSWWRRGPRWEQSSVWLSSKLFSPEYHVLSKVQEGKTPIRLERSLFIFLQELVVLHRFIVFVIEILQELWNISFSCKFSIYFLNIFFFLLCSTFVHVCLPIHTNYTNQTWRRNRTQHMYNDHGFGCTF